LAAIEHRAVAFLFGTSTGCDSISCIHVVDESKTTRTASLLVDDKIKLINLPKFFKHLLQGLLVCNLGKAKNTKNVRRFGRHSPSSWIAVETLLANRRASATTFR
jgi:hypothetical protein